MKKLIALLSVFSLFFCIVFAFSVQAEKLDPCEDCTLSFSKKKPSDEGSFKQAVKDIRNESGNIPFLIESGGHPVFTLEGVDYQLPLDLKDLLEKGWQARLDNKFKKLAPATQDFISLKKDGSFLSIGVYNPGKEAINILDAKVNIFWIDDYNTKNLDLILPGNLSLSSTLEDVQTAYGMPSYESSAFNFHNLAYGDLFGGFYDININFYDTNYRMNSYRLSLNADYLQEEYTLNSGKSGEQQVDLNKIPEELGEDLMTFNFMLEDDIFTLPSSFELFLNRGWEFEGKRFEERVAPDDYGYITMHKEDKSIRMEAVNTGFADQAVKDCVVFNVSASRNFDNKPSANIILPGGLDFSSDVEEITVAYGKPDEYSNLVGTTPHITYLKDPDESYGDRVEFLFDALSGDLKSVSLTVNSFHEKSPYTGKLIKETIASIEEAAKLNPDFAKYVVPKKLSEEISDLSFKLGEEIYSVPLPLAHFLENGWELMKNNGSLIKGSQRYIRGDAKIIKNNQIVTVKLSNPMPEPLPLEACLVKGVQIDKSSAAYLDLEIPGGFTFAATYEELSAAYAEQIDEERSREGEFLIIKNPEDNGSVMLIFDEENNLRSIFFESN